MMKKMSSKIIIVDSKDNPIGLCEYSEVHYKDIYRVAALWLTDKKSHQVLVAQRKWTKHNDPGVWSASAAGTVEENETYRQNIIKETAEELGLSDLTFRQGPKQFVDDGKHKYFCQWFFSEVDKGLVKIKIQEDEVEAIRWLGIPELEKDSINNPGKYKFSIFYSLKKLMPK
jgi:isopentenyldiphosphate isomerase